MPCPVLPSRPHRQRKIATFDAVLLHWFTLGLLLLLILPMAHWHNPWVGWLPYWLICVPGGMLLFRMRLRIQLAVP